MKMEELIDILEEIKPGVDWEKETDLIGDHILGALSDEFDIEITPIDIVPENFKTVKAIYAMVKRLEDE